MGDRCGISLLTPPGRGAVATVAVQGPRALQHVAARFVAAAGKPLEQIPAGRILLGRWQTGDGAGEELIVCVREQSVEIHCHGGQAAARLVIDTLVSDGCQLLSWQEMLRQTAGDAIVVEAQLALARATTQRAAAILLDQLQGALQRALTHTAELLAAGQAAQAGAVVNELLDRATLGLRLIDPFRVVLCGPPNAGKSSLINALAGYQRALVFDRPGTTRDVVTAHTALDGWPVELADTAGLREARDAIESAGIDLARQRLAGADLIVLVFDASRAWDDACQGLRDQLPAAMVVHNKCDLSSPQGDTRPQGLATSAAIGQGIDELARAITARLVPQPPPPGAAVPFTRRQRELLQRARAALDKGDLQAATFQCT